MLSREKFAKKFQAACLWIFVFQLGILVGIEAVYLAVFTENDGFLRAYRSPTLAVIGLTTSLYPIFAAVGAALILYFVHVLGSVAIISGASLVWLIGCFVGSFAVGNIGALMAARVIKGLAIGLLTSVLPLYVDKAASSKRQAARLLTLLQASAPFGVFLMAVLAKTLTPIEFNLRWICAAVPALPIVLVVLNLPRGDDVIDQARENKRLSRRPDQSAWSKMILDIRLIGRSKYNVSRFVAASLAQASVPLTAINVIFYYSNVMCQMLGFSAAESEVMAIGLYATNFVATGLSLLFINRLHRQATIQYTSLGLGAIHLMLFIVELAHDYHPESGVLGIVSVSLLFLFVFVFSLLFSGISLVYTSEVVSQRTRGVSIGLATSIGWLCNFLVTLISAAILPMVGSYIFLIFAVICCGMYCAFAAMPSCERT